MPLTPEDGPSPLRVEQQEATALWLAARSGYGESLPY